MAVWVARGSYGNLCATGFLNRRNRFFSSRKACPPRRTLCGFAALRAYPVRRGGFFPLAKTCPPRRTGAEPQRNCGPLGLTSGGLGFFAACPAEIRVRRGGRELTFGKQACQPRLVQIPVSKHKNQGLTLNRGSFFVSA